MTDPGPLPGTFICNVFTYDLCVVEDKVGGEVPLGVDTSPLGVIPPYGGATTPGNENGGNGMVAGITLGIGVGKKLLDQLDV